MINSRSSGACHKHGQRVGHSGVCNDRSILVPLTRPVYLQRCKYSNLTTPYSGFQSSGFSPLKKRCVFQLGSPTKSPQVQTQASPFDASVSSTGVHDSITPRYILGNACEYRGGGSTSLYTRMVQAISMEHVTSVIEHTEKMISVWPGQQNRKKQTSKGSEMEPMPTRCDGIKNIDAEDKKSRKKRKKNGSKRDVGVYHVLPATSPLPPGDPR